MIDKKRALGRGLDSLIPAARQTAPVVREVIKEVEVVKEVAVPGEGVQEIRLDEIEPSPYQPRRHNDSEALQELAASIRASGVMQPIVVREITAGIVRYQQEVPEGERDPVEVAIWGGHQRPHVESEKIRYQLIAGERRWLASKLAEKETIPALVRKVSNEQAAELSLIENLQREDLNPMEMAYAFARLANEFNLTQEQISARTGKERATVANHLRLLKLPAEAQGFLAYGKLSFGHAKVLLGLPDKDAIDLVLAQVIQHQLSVRQTEELAKKHMWDTTVKEVTGPEPEKPRRDPNVADAERQLMAALGTKVTISDRGGKGKVVIEYKTLEDFDRIVEALGK